MARDVQELHDLLVAANVELPPMAHDLLGRLRGATLHLRDGIHDAGLEPDDGSARPRLR